MSTTPGSRLATLERVFGITTLVLLVAGCFLVLRPFVSALLWAVILGFTLWPLHERLRRRVRERRTLAAALTTSALTLVLVLPFVFIAVSLSDDIRDLRRATRQWLERGPAAVPSWVGELPLVGPQADESLRELVDYANHVLRSVPAETLSPELPEPSLFPEPEASAPGVEDYETPRIVTAGKQLLLAMRSSLMRLGFALGRGMFEVFASVFLVFFIFQNGDRVVPRIQDGLQRLVGPRAKHLLEVAGGTVRGVVYGILGTAILQGILAGLGFALSGVPGAALLGLLTFFLSPVPMGPPLLWVPAVFWLFHRDATGWAIFLAIWGLGVSSIDNFVKPWLISHGSRMPFVLVFFGVLGGALAFGFIGVFLGPTLLAVGYRLVEEWLATRAATPEASPASPEPPPSPEPASRGSAAPPT